MMYVLLILDLGSGYFNEAFPDCRGCVGGKGSGQPVSSCSLFCSDDLRRAILNSDHDEVN